MGKRKYDIKDEDKEGKKEKISKNEEITEETANEQQEENVSSDPTCKFDIKHFRKELNARQGQTIALTQFLQVCTNPDMKIDYLLQYLKSGGNAHEILRQINLENKKNLTLATPTFHLFHLIILKVQSSLPHMIGIVEEACRYFLNTFMPTVEIMISEHSSPRHRKIILKLFTSMVTLNPDLGIEILNQAPLTPKHLQYIVEKANYKEKDNVRTAFVHFITSFLVEGHLPLIKALLEKQGLLPLVIPGLIQDELEAVVMFLNILKTNVVENQLISKSLKLKTFSHIVLHNLFKLYYWKGPADLEYNLKPEMKLVITALLSEIILKLFTSHKQGLYFLDRSLGTTDTHKNQNLYKAILSLKRPWENKEQCEVILEITDKCPDLHRALITVIEQSFEPQNSPVWQKTADFVCKLLDKIKPDDLLERMSHLNQIQVVNFIRFTTLPIPLLKFLKQGIANQDIFVINESVQVIVKMMETLKKYFQLLEICNNSTLDLLKNRLEGFIPKHLPTPDNIVSIINFIMQESGQNKNKEVPEILTSTSLVNLFDLLLLYHQIQPASLEGIEGHLNMKNALSYVEKLSENVLLLKFKVVSLWLSLDPNELSLRKTIFSDLLLIMLEVYTNTDDDISLQSKNTLNNFLKSTTIFEGSEEEIDIVLYTLKNVKIKKISVFVEVIQTMISNLDMFKSNLNSCVKNSETNEEDDVDNISKLFDHLSSDNIESIDSKTFINEKIPSPFILGCLHAHKENENNRKALEHFITAFSINLMHHYASPKLMMSIFESCNMEVHSYIASWLTHPIPLHDKFARNDKVINKIASYVLDGSTQFEEIFPHFDVVSDENYDIQIRSFKLKWNLLIKINCTEQLAWSNLLTFYLLQLTKLDIFNETHLEKILCCLDVIMASSKQNKTIDINRKILSHILMNSNMLQLFSPICKSENSGVTLLTKFILYIVKQYGEQVHNLHTQLKIMKPYQEKLFFGLQKLLKKNCKKKTKYDEEVLLNVYDIIGMNKENTTDIVKLIVNIDSKCTVTENKEPSIVMRVLGLILTKDSLSNNLPPDIISRIVNLYTKVLKDPEINITLVDFENILKEYFEKQPQLMKYVSKESFKDFFSSKVIRKSTSQLAATLLRGNSQLCEVFKQEIQNPEVIGQRELALPLGEAIINHVQFTDQNTPLLQKIFAEYKSSIHKVLEKPHKAGQIYNNHWKFITKLIFECMDGADCVKFFEKIHKFETVELFHVQIMHATFMKICISDEYQKKIHLHNYFTMMLSLLSDGLKSNIEHRVLKDIVINIETVTKIIKQIKIYEIEHKNQFKKLTENAVWKNFCKVTLKHSLKIRTSDDDNDIIGPLLLNLISTLVKLFYEEDDEDIVTLFEIVTSHSEFLNVMLSHHSTDVKSRLIEFLYALILRNKSVMKSEQIPVYLSAYHATRSPSDKLILSILCFYEKHGLAIHQYRPYIWGDSGANYYAVKKNRASSLWSQPTPNQILNMLDKDVIEKTITCFPVNQKLDYQYKLPLIDETRMEIINTAAVLIEQMKSDVIFTFNKKKNITSSVNNLILKSKYDPTLYEIKEMDFISESQNVDETCQNIYDPAFLLPIMSQLLAPGSVISCFKLVRNGLLGLPLVALSSHCPLMRAAAYHVLHRFCQQLETESKHRSDKIFITDFIDTLRQSLSTAIISAQKENDSPFDQKNPRLPTVAALYLAKSINVATMPFDPLYKPVNNFLIAKQQIDLSVVPDFLSLFHDSEVESAERRLWILKIMTEGTKSFSDVNVIFKTMTLKMIMDFYSTNIADKKTKNGILEFLSSIVSIPRAAEILIEGYGLMSWLNGIVKDLKQDQKSLIVNFITLLNNLSKSLCVSAFSKILSNLKRRVKDKNDGIELDVNDFGDLKMNKEIELQILYLLLDILPFSNILSLEEQELYLGVLITLSKKTVKLMSKNNFINLIKNSVQNFENVAYAQILMKAVTFNDAKILKSENLELADTNNIEDYSVKIQVLRKLRAIVLMYS